MSTPGIFRWVQQIRHILHCPWAGPLGIQLTMVGEGPCIHSLSVYMVGDTRVLQEWTKCVKSKGSSWKFLFISCLHYCHDFLNFSYHFLGAVLPAPALCPHLEFGSTQKWMRWTNAKKMLSMLKNLIVQGYWNISNRLLIKMKDQMLTTEDKNIATYDTDHHVHHPASFRIY